MELIFLGTPAFAVPTLERIVGAGHRVLAVFTQPDRPKGRGGKVTPSPVKEAALRLGLPVHQPERIRRPEVVEQLKQMNPDAMVVVGYGQIIPQAIIDIPPLGIINVHASLLPKYRGAAPIQWAVANGETRTGVTTMRIDAGLDTGDMLLKWETEIGPEEDALELGARLADAGAELLVETLRENPAPVTARSCRSHVCADPEKRRRRDRLDLAGVENLQSIARVSAVAGRIQFFSRPNVSHLEGARCDGRSHRRSRADDCAEEAPADRVRRRDSSWTARSSSGRPQANVRRSILERAAFERQRNAGGESGVKLPLGYRYSAVYAGIRKVKKDDLALIVSDAPASGAAVFTQNRVQAAPVRIARWNLTKSRGLVSAVLINAGNANCATRTGDRVALACCDAVANHSHVSADAGFSGVHRRDRRGTGCAPDRERLAGLGRGTGARPL